MLLDQRLPALVVVALTVARVAVASPTAPPHRMDVVDTIGVRVIALLPTSIPPDAPNNATGRRVFDSLLRAALTRAGFQVLLPDVVEPVWRQSTDSVRGFYDPATGEFMAEKWAGVSGAVARELGAWGVVHAKVVFIPVTYGGGAVVEYDGVKERVSSRAGAGVVPALTLSVVVVDSTGVPVQCGRGGIQLLTKGSIWYDGVRPVKSEAVFADVDRDVLATERALGGLLRGQPTCEP